MWQNLFWAEGFFPPDLVRFDLEVCFAPAWLLRKATRSASGRWSWTTVKR